jgi:hypothetical protein
LSVQIGRPVGARIPMGTETTCHRRMLTCS